MQPGSNVRPQLITFDSQTERQHSFVPIQASTSTATNSSSNSLEMRLPGHVQPLQSPLQQLTHQIVPIRDSNTNIRICYLALCSTRSSTQRNLLKLLSLLRDIFRSNRTSQDAQNINERDDIYQRFSEMVVCWRKNGRGSIVAFAIKHRNLDSLLINSLKAVFRRYGGPQNILDQLVDINLQQAWTCLTSAGFTDPRNMLVERADETSVIISLTKEEEELVLNRQEEERVAAERNRMAETSSSYHPSLNGQEMNQIRKNLKMKDKLKSLQSCIFYSLLH